jgi:hypothetical protein
MCKLAKKKANVRSNGRGFGTRRHFRRWLIAARLGHGNGSRTTQGGQHGGGQQESGD